MNIIDDPKELIKLTIEERDELLLDDKYNKVNLRQLIRDCLLIIRLNNEHIDYLKHSVECHENNFNSLRDKIVKVVNFEI